MKPGWKGWRQTYRPKKVAPPTSPFLLTNHIRQSFPTDRQGIFFAYNFFRSILDKYVQEMKHSRTYYSVVFDIDNTVLEYVQYTYGTQLRLKSPYVLQLYNLFLKHKIPIYFVTARPNSPTGSHTTVRELQQLGFQSYKGIYYMPSINDNIGAFKAAVRSRLAPILFSVGDQWTDMTNEPILPSYDYKCYWLQKLEPGCEWALKFMPPHSSFLSSPFQFVSTKRNFLDSVYESMEPLGPEEPRAHIEFCSHCGHLRQ
jgi:hypothetical protein